MDADYAAEYERLHRDHWWWQARTVFVRSVIRSLDLPPDAVILDIGCGGGWAFDDWESFGTAFGVERDLSLVEVSGRHRSKIHAGPFDESYQPGRRFSLIVMLDVLEHLEYPREALTHALSLLEPTGRILITVPALPSTWTSHDDLNHHFIRYTRRTFREIAHASGLQIDRLEYFFHWTTAVKYLLRFKEAIFNPPPQSPTIPATRMNDFFRRFSLAEQRLITPLHPPFGTSLLCVGRKPTASH